MESVTEKTDKKVQGAEDYEFRDEELIENALIICIEAHKDKKRKGIRKPYYIHPIMVALKLTGYGASPDVIAAALIHDVLEDTDYPKEKLRKELNDKVVDMAEALTYDDTLEWEDKKSKYIETVSNADKGVKMIALSDKIHNLQSLIQAHKVKGKSVFKMFKGTREFKMSFGVRLLEALRDINHPLIDEYEMMLEIEKRLE